MTEPKPRDQVRGWVKGRVLDDGCVAVDNWHVPLTILHDVEIPSPPEPGSQLGDLVLDADGIAWMQGPLCWWYSIPDVLLRTDATMHRPLRRARIVPEDDAS